jgi:3-methylfumaryl-CoA hydratase
MPVDILSLAQARRVSAMLGIDPETLSTGDLLPRGWHFALLAGETPRGILRTDGFPGLGVPMPQLDYPRLLLGQRSTSFHGDLLIGDQIIRHSALGSMVEKTGRNGPFAIVTVDHSLTSAGDQPQVVETQTYVLTGPAAAPMAKPAAVLPLGGHSIMVTPDDLMLFQYSALGFNTHRIHFDRDHARNEGYPDLVVNGGLATLLATEHLRRELGHKIHTLTARHTAPLCINRPLTIFVPDLTETPAKVLLLDDEGVLAAELVITLDEL